MCIYVCQNLREYCVLTLIVNLMAFPEAKSFTSALNPRHSSFVERAGFNCSASHSIPL